MRWRMIGLAVVALLWAALPVTAFAAETEATKAAEPRPAERLAYIAVVGAPGDGEKALADALAKRLAAIGIAAGSAQAVNVYLVEGTVKLVAAKNGRQGVRIDWIVFAPDGKTLGGVSQMKLVRKGSLDKKWGSAADAAASAAAAEIAKLLPQ